MILKVISWNIGGAKTLQQGADPGLMASYSVDAIDYIIESLKKFSPDIVCLQEIQKNDSYDQAEMIASALGLPYYFHHSFSLSHNEDGTNLGNAVLSRYPIVEKSAGIFLNPNIEVIWEDGSVAKTHDKGYVNCLLNIEGREVSVSTLHLTPFNKFGMSLDDERAKSILDDVSSNLTNQLRDQSIILGDFNIDDSRVLKYFKKLASQSVSEVELHEPTTPKGKKYDHVLFKGVALVDQEVDSQVSTDHFIVVSSFGL
jgi:endonuclease/exonuclease/phosphatase family metal-dependent hydrolase